MLIPQTKRSYIMAINMDTFNTNVATLKKIEDRERLEILYAAMLTRMVGDAAAGMGGGEEFTNFVNTVPLDTLISSVTR
jgi:hypothetical protein